MMKACRFVGVAVMLVLTAVPASADDPAHRASLFDRTGGAGHSSNYLSGGDLHVFSGKRYEVPRIPTAETYQGNVEMMRSIAKRDPVEATRLWINAVWPDGERRPQILNPPSAVNDPRWDYKIVVQKMGNVYSTEAEDAGNMNFYLTGVATFSTIAEKAGISGRTTDTAIEWLVRLGGATAQIIGDVQHGKWGRTEHTFYGEERKDAQTIDNAREYWRFLELERMARSVGIHLDPQEFGIKAFEPNWRSLLLGGDEREPRQKAEESRKPPEFKAPTEDDEDEIEGPPLILP